jgi:serine/threonine protein kinase
MVFEYCAGGDLARYIHKNKRLSESKAQYFMKQLGKAKVPSNYSLISITASALRFLRSKNIIHRDLKVSDKEKD